MRAWRILALLVVGELVLLASPASAVPGELDTTFSSDGIAFADFGGLDFANGAAIQADGKVVAAGQTGGVAGSTPDFAVARFTTGGTLDATFSGDGMARTNFFIPQFFLSLEDGANDLLIQPDQKIVVAGVSGSSFALARYNSDGTLDPTFSEDGKVRTNFTPDPDYAVAVALQPNGKIVVAGTASLEFAVARYNADGSLDTTFSGDGKLMTTIGGETVGWGMALQADGKIVVVGKSLGKFAVARYETDGDLDPTFSGDGKVNTAFPGTQSQALDVAVQTDQRIIVSGHSRPTARATLDFALARYETDGDLDPTFSGDGLKTTDFGRNDYAYSVAVQADGKIVAGGQKGNILETSSDVNFALARFTAGGALDASFSGNGKVVTDLGSNSRDEGRDVVLQDNGKIVMVGRGNGNDFAAVRYLVA